jgi:hypothetical protein
MLILSNSYIVTEDFLQSVRDNLGVLEYPAPFRDFLTYTNYINSSVKTGLRRMEAQVNNDYFSQWVNVLILAQDDRNMEYVTMSVVDAIGRCAAGAAGIRHSHVCHLARVFYGFVPDLAAPLIFRVLMKDAYTVLVTTLPGQVLLTFLLAAVVFSLVRAYRLTSRS